MRPLNWDEKAKNYKDTLPYKGHMAFVTGEQVTMHRQTDTCHLRATRTISIIMILMTIRATSVMNFVCNELEITAKMCPRIAPIYRSPSAISQPKSMNWHRICCTKHEILHLCALDFCASVRVFFLLSMCSRWGRRQNGGYYLRHICTVLIRLVWRDLVSCAPVWVASSIKIDFCSPRRNMTKLFVPTPRLASCTFTHTT